MAKKDLPKLTVSLRNAHHQHSLSRTLRDLRPILDLNKPTDVTLDLSDLTFISPAPLALTVATFRHAREAGTFFQGRVIYPTSVAAKTYLYRMDAVRVLFEKEPDIEVTYDVERHEASGLKECEHFPPPTEVGG